MKAASVEPLSQEDIVAKKNARPKTPVMATENKTIKATVAECPTMNYLLQRLEMGNSLDLSAQLAILENDSIFCGLVEASFGSSTLEPN